MENSDKLLSFISIGCKAGAVKSGTSICIDFARKGKTDLLILASDASENTKKHVRDCAAYHDVSLITCYSKQELGHYCGRGEISVIAVCDKCFSREIRKLYQQKLGGDAIL